MTRFDGGYEGPKKLDPEKNPTSPNEQVWTVEREANGDGQTIYATIKLDGMPLGTIILPSVLHLQWLRQRVRTR